MGSGHFFMLLSLVLARFSNADFETDLKYIRACNRTSPVTMRMVNEVLISKKLPSSMVALDNFKCFLHCLFKHYGWMDDIGGFELDTIHRNLVETGSIGTRAMTQIMYGCTALEEMNKCERAFLFIRCFWQKSEDASADSDDEKFFYALEEQDQNVLIR